MVHPERGINHGAVVVGRQGSSKRSVGVVCCHAAIEARDGIGDGIGDCGKGVDKGGAGRRVGRKIGPGLFF